MQLSKNRFYSAFLLILSLWVCGCQGLSDKAPGVIRILAIGDSITRGDTWYEVDGVRNTIQGGWVSRLSQRRFLSSEGELEFINQGVNGDTVQAVYHRLDRDLFAHDPDIIILGVGTNDVYGEGLTFPAAGGRVHTSAWEYKEGVRGIIEEIQMNLPKAKLILLGMSTPVVELWQRSWMAIAIDLPSQDQLDGEFSAYNAVLKDLSTEYQLSFVDIADTWPKDPERRASLYSDGIHPNDSGYEKMAETIAQVLETQLKK